MVRSGSRPSVTVRVSRAVTSSLVVITAVTIVPATHPAIGVPSSALAVRAQTFDSAKIVLSATSGVIGTSITITGTGFPPGEIAALYIDLPSPYLDVPGPLTDVRGGFETTTKWPARNYDATGRVNPTTPGPHLVCGDTGYPGSAQQYAAKACAQFVVEQVPPSPTATPTPSPALASGPPIYGALAVLGVLVVLGAGAFLLLRRSA